MQKYLSSLKNIVLAHKWFIFILLLASLIRFLYIQDNVVPFLFDHGKDSLAILHMLVVPELKFVGPWTSISGLYFGPAWYYLLAPFYWASGLNPASAAVAMSILVLLQMCLVYKYFNLESAVIIGFSGFWLMISRSAWNPYPMTLLTITLIIVLLKQLKLPKLDNKLIAVLALISSLGFHFSSAFAIFYPIIVLLVLVLYKFRVTIKNCIIALIFFALPFTPQILFEIKNNFSQTRAIFEYFARGGESEELSIKKITHVITTIYGEVRTIVFESYSEQSAQVFGVLFLLFLIGAIISVLQHKKLSERFKNILIISVLFFIVPTIGFFFLHFNLWYVYPLLPVATILVGTLIHKLPKPYSIAFIAVYILAGLLRLDSFLSTEKPKFLDDSGMYVTKQKVVQYIREDAGIRDFSVYTYQPDIYDFPYQYEFLLQGLSGNKLPVEFAYEPDVPTYVREKEDVLQVIDRKYGSDLQDKPEIIYYIVTDKRESELLTGWWGRQKYDQIIAEKKFGDKLVVYSATPKTDSVLKQ